MFPSTGHVRTLGFLFKAKCLVVLLSALFLTGYAQAQWHDPLATPSFKNSYASHALLLDIATADSRLVAVGAFGHIIYSDDNGKTWQQADVPVSVTLTKVTFVSGQLGWAVGHDGVILHSQDGGQSWKKQFDGFEANTVIVKDAQLGLQRAEQKLATAEEQDDSDAIDAAAEALDDASFAYDDAVYDNDTGSTKPFLDVWFYDAHRGFVVGAYGMVFYTEDGGEHWQNGTPLIPNPDRLHLNSVNSIGGSSLVLTGETGLIIRSDDLGKSWHLQDSPYNGSLFGISTKGELQLAYGLRGNIFRSSDAGLTWEQLEIASEQAILSGLVTRKNTYLVGNAGILIVFNSQLKQPQEYTVSGRKDIAGIAQAKDGSLVIVGESGVLRINEQGELLAEQASMAAKKTGAQ